MSKIDELIALYCPDGVEWKELGELGYLYGGLNGKSKSDFEKGNAKYITYKNIYSNISVDINAENYVLVHEGERQNKVEIGDVLFTGSSENKQDCGMSSELTELSNENLYLNSFSFGFRLKDKALFISGFFKYLFRDSKIREQIIKTASGVTRMNISKKRFEKITIPIPPLPVQEEIVSILDKFTALEAELEAELEARTRQYEYYRNELLSFEGKDVEWKSLGEVSFYSKSRIAASEICSNTYVGVDNLFQNKKGKTYSTYVPTSGNLTKFIPNDILIGNIRPYLKKIWKSNISGGTNGDVLVIRINEDNKTKINPDYLYYLLSSDSFFDFNMQYAKGAKMPRGDKESILKYPIPIPSIEEQERIVGILDKFDALVNDISTGLPAEIQARRQQYEYYRGKLLTFEPLTA